MLGAGGTDGLLAGKLGFAVHAEWRRLRVLAIWRFTLPVEDVIGGVMHKRHTIGRAPGCDDAGCRRIGTGRTFPILLGTIYRRVSGGIDHTRRLDSIQQCGQRLRRIEVCCFTRAAVGQLATTRGGLYGAIDCQRTQQFRTHLPICAKKTSVVTVYTPASAQRAHRPETAQRRPLQRAMDC